MNAAAVQFLGAVAVDLPKRNNPFSRLAGLLMSDVLLIVGVGLALVVLLALGFYLWTRLRRNRRRHIRGGHKVFRGAHRHGESEDVSSADEDPDEDEEDDADEADHAHTGSEDASPHDRRRYKYRVRRRSHRNRNPTLSETGGLPPPKAPEAGKP